MAGARAGEGGSAWAAAAAEAQGSHCPRWGWAPARGAAPLHPAAGYRKPLSPIPVIPWERAEPAGVIPRGRQDDPRLSAQSQRGARCCCCTRCESAGSSVSSSELSSCQQFRSVLRGALTESVTYIWSLEIMRTSKWQTVRVESKGGHRLVLISAAW